MSRIHVDENHIVRDKGSKLDGKRYEHLTEEEHELLIQHIFDEFMSVPTNKIIMDRLAEI